jgi:lipoprotein-anchoring transpeptidase ErfK/SrfK
MRISVIALLVIVLFVCACKQSGTAAEKIKTERQAPKANVYHFEKAKPWLEKNKSDTTALQIAFALNRTDSANFSKMDSVIIAADMRGEIADYLPFPLNVTMLESIHKIIFFSYSTQVFAAYEKGVLIYTGPTNMGRKKDPTPTGLFYANWKAEQTTSTFNDEWDLRWNVNIENKEGIGWHQYALPGYPASHSCLRLQEKDARYLYNWADQWILDGKDSVLVNGTPVIVFGQYNFDAPKPWWQLPANPRAIDMPEAEIEKQAAAFFNIIIAEQSKRDTFPKAEL